MFNAKIRTITITIFLVFLKTQSAFCQDIDSTRILFTFNNQKSIENWNGNGGIIFKDNQDTSSSLMISNTYAPQLHYYSIQLPSNLLNGKIITLRARIKATNISEPPNPWNGIKVMLVLETNQGTTYQSIQVKSGTFGWTIFEKKVRLPVNIKRIRLFLGLEDVTGQVLYDNVEIAFSNPPKKYPVMIKGHNLERLRGVMISNTTVTKKDLEYLSKEWNANQIRWQLGNIYANDSIINLNSYDRWLEKELLKLDTTLSICEKLKLNICLDLHSAPGGLDSKGNNLVFYNLLYKNKFIETWNKIAKRYKGRKIIYAYDLVNEPHEPIDSCKYPWTDLASEVVNSIRKIDPSKPIIVEPRGQNFDDFIPLTCDSIIYSYHMYSPWAFAGQGLGGLPAAITYPGIISGTYWNKEKLRTWLVPVWDFQKAFNVQIYIGEFSAIRWAPDNSAYRYIKDLIEIFEDYGWDWSYHAFREFDGWSVEHDTDIHDHTPSKIMTDREKLLRKYFQKINKIHKYIFRQKRSNNIFFLWLYKLLFYFRRVIFFVITTSLCANL